MVVVCGVSGQTRLNRISDLPGDHLRTRVATRERRAGDAHPSKAIIRQHQGVVIEGVVGDLRRQGQRWRLDYPREFEILSPDTEDDAEPST